MANDDLESKTQKDHTGIEQRKAPRIMSRIKMHFCIVGEHAKEWRSVTTKNVSVTGALFLYDKFLPLGGELDIRMLIPHVKREIKLSAKIVRVDDLGLKGYSYGVCFEGVNKETREIIKNRIELMNINNILSLATKKGASDVHLCVNNSPLMRLGGKLVKMDLEPLERRDMEDMLFNILTQEQIDKLLEDLELDSSCDLARDERFRFNIHFQRGNIEATFRRIHARHLSIKSLGLPDIVEDFALGNGGLVVITGGTNNGKTTTASAMIHLINDTKNAVILTIEDPVEYIYPSNKSVIKQREVGLDTKSFASAAKHVLRQDCDVVFIGEILDPETLLICLRAAEVGHLVITTYPARDCVQAIERMVYSVEPYMQHQVRMQLSNTLLGVIAQKLCSAKSDPLERVVATEVVVNIPAVSRCVRDGNFIGIRNSIQTNAASGMHTMRSSIEDLTRRGLISESYLKEIDHSKSAEE